MNITLLLCDDSITPEAIELFLTELHLLSAYIADFLWYATLIFVVINKKIWRHLEMSLKIYLYIWTI